MRALLPRLEVDLEALRAGRLFTPTRELWLEIGFGGGEHLLARAAENPDIGLIGCEPFVNGVAKLLAGIAAQDLQNIRVFADDATALLAAAPEAAFSRVYLLYPDPWPKRRQHKRRFISEPNVAALARVLKPGGEVRFATDIDDYAGWTLRRFLASPEFSWQARAADAWRTPWEGWAPTRYEAKARAAGRVSAYLTFTRRAAPRT
jgi:tRNA (guanine-N7-)-methyltransferase